MPESQDSLLVGGFERARLQPCRKLHRHPLVGRCSFTNSDAPYSDNTPSQKHGAKRHISR